MHKTEVEQPRMGPLESPFAEIIPTGEVLYLDLNLYFGTYKTSEETRYFSSGSIVHSRFIGNEDSFTVPDKSKELESVFINMVIYVCQDEEGATKFIQKEKTKKWFDGSDNEFYAKLFGVPTNDIAGSVHFWKEPGDSPVEGSEEIIFKVGHYVGWYKVQMDNPIEAEDGYFMPPKLHDLLQLAVNKTIPKLRSFQPK